MPSHDCFQVWRKPLSDGSVAIVALNRGNSTKDITVDLSACAHGSGAFAVSDIWTGKKLGSATGNYTAKALPAHGHAFLKLSKAAGDAAVRHQRAGGARRAGVPAGAENGAAAGADVVGGRGRGRSCAPAKGGRLARS